MERYHFLGMSKDYGEYVALLAAYDLALRGYDGLALSVLESVPQTQLDGVHCQIFLSAYEPVEAEHAEFFRALSDRLSPNCRDALDSYARMKLRAELDCASSGDEVCLGAGERFKQRFPLAAGAAEDIDAIRATSLYKEMYVGKADAIADSLFERGVRSELLAEAVYRKGVSFLIEKAGDEAKQTFLIMEDYFPESRLRPDVYFKLGTTYYITEAYDSSAAYFRLAADRGDVALRQDALFNLGLALEESGKLREASRAFFELAAGFPFSDRFERALMRSAYCLEKDGLPMESRDIYKTLLKYAGSPATRAEANFWLGECLAEAGLHGEAALEFLRTGYLYPGEEAWAGTALYRAGMECQSAGLREAAKLIYEENVSTFGRESTWGAASYEKLRELVGEH
jgi:TolA-binding protein